MSYALSLSFFEAAPLIALRRTGCRSVVLLADMEGYRVSVSEAGVSQVGRTYELGPVSVDKGIFHPKVMLLNGADGPRAAIGSGNLTFNGWGGNLEMLDYLSPATAAGAFGDLADFLESIQTTQRVHAVWPDLTGFVESCRSVSRKESDGRTRLLYSLERSIADQIVDAAGELGGALSATFVSPYFGSVGAIVGLAKRLMIEDVSVLVPNSTPEYFPFDMADAIGWNVKPVVAQRFSNDPRRLHAKMIEVVCRRGRLMLTGSVNSTGPALTELKNVEVGVLRTLGAASIFGWKVAARPTGAGAGGQMPSRSLQPVLIANFDGTTLSGRIFGISKPTQLWKASLADDLGRTNLDQMVEINSDGEFRVEVKGAVRDIWRSHSSFRLSLRNATHEVIGWVMLAPYLAAIRERGPVAEAVIRIVSGSEDQSDIATILGFFTENPESLLSIASRHGSSSSSGETGLMEGSISPADLLPISREQARQGGGNGEARSAFQQLLDRLRDYVSASPVPESQISEEEEEEEATGTKPLPGRRSPRQKRIRHHDFFRLVDAFVERIENRSAADVARRGDLITLLNLGLFFSARSEDSISLRSQFLDQWIGLGLRLTHASDKPDELEQMLFLVLLAQVVSKQSKPETVLAMLQRRLRSAIPEPWAHALRSSLNSNRPITLISEATVENWTDAFDRVIGGRTPWMDAMEVWDAFKTGKEITKTNSLLREPEANRLRAIAIGEADLDDVRVIERTANVPACPIHSMTLPAIQIGRLRTQHIATAANCCHRILLDLGP